MPNFNLKIYLGNKHAVKWYHQLLGYVDLTDLKCSTEQSYVIGKMFCVLFF